jgi:hypothetical protein
MYLNPFLQKILRNFKVDLASVDPRTPELNEVTKKTVQLLIDSYKESPLLKQEMEQINQVKSNAQQGGKFSKKFLSIALL